MIVIQVEGWVAHSAGDPIPQRFRVYGNTLADAVKALSKVPCIEDSEWSRPCPGSIVLRAQLFLRVGSGGAADVNADSVKHNTPGCWRKECTGSSAVRPFVLPSHLSQGELQPAPTTQSGKGGA